MSAPAYIHANALVVGETGLLLRGPSRAGKSTLTLAIVARANALGRFARLVGDDRVSIEAQNGAVIARPHPRIAGMIERRGHGIVQAPYATSCALRLVVNLTPNMQLGGAAPPPGASDQEMWTQVASIRLPQIAENAFDDACAGRILDYIQRLVTI